MAEQTKIEITGDGKHGPVKVTVEGATELPFWKHDLKLEAVLALLATVDSKDFYEEGLADELDEYHGKVMEALNFALGR